MAVDPGGGGAVIRVRIDACVRGDTRMPKELFELHVSNRAVKDAGRGHYVAELFNPAGERVMVTDLTNFQRSRGALALVREVLGRLDDAMGVPDLPGAPQHPALRDAGLLAGQEGAGKNPAGEPGQGADWSQDALMNRPLNLDELYLLHVRDGQPLLGRVSGVALAQWNGAAEPAYRVVYLDGTFEYLPMTQVTLDQLGSYETLLARQAALAG